MYFRSEQDKLQQTLSELAKEHSNIMFLTVEERCHKSLQERYELTPLPVFVIMEDRKERMRILKGQESSLQNAVTKFVRDLARPSHSAPKLKHGG